MFEDGQGALNVEESLTFGCSKGEVSGSYFGDSVEDEGGSDGWGGGQSGDGDDVSGVDEVALGVEGGDEVAGGLGRKESERGMGG